MTILTLNIALINNCHFYNYFTDHVVIESEKVTVIEIIPETSTDTPLGQQHSNNNESDVLEEVLSETPSSVEQEASLPAVKTKKVSARPANVARQHPNTKGSKMTSTSPSTSAKVNIHKPVTSSVKANTKPPNNKRAMKPPLRDSTTSDLKVKKPVPVASVDSLSSDTSKHKLHAHVHVREKSHTNSDKKNISETPAKNVTPSVQDEISILLINPSSIDVEKQLPIPSDGITTTTGTHKPVPDPSITKKVGIKKKKKL